MKKVISLVLLVMFISIFVGCAAHVHKVGNGAQGSQMEQGRQWYILFGLIPLNNVDTATMAGNTQDYTIKTETSAVDIILNIFTSYVTINSRTVTVTK